MPQSNNLKTISQIRQWQEGLIRQLCLAFKNICQFFPNHQKYSEIACDFLLLHGSTQTKRIANYLQKSHLIDQSLSDKYDEQELTEILNCFEKDDSNLKSSNESIRTLNIPQIFSNYLRDKLQNATLVQSAVNNLLLFRLTQSLSDFISLITVEPDNEMYHFIAIFLIVLKQNQTNILLRTAKQQQFFFSVCQTILFEQKITKRLGLLLKMSSPKGRKIASRFCYEGYNRLQQAIKLIKENQLQGATEKLKENIQNNDNLPISYSILAHIEIQQKGQSDSMKKSVKYQTQQIKGLTALINMKMEQYQTAIENFQMVLTKTNNHTLPNFKSQEISRLMRVINQVNKIKQNKVKQLISQCEQFRGYTSYVPSTRQLRKKYKYELNKEHKVQFGLQLAKQYQQQYQYKKAFHIYQQILQNEPNPQIKWKLFKLTTTKLRQKQQQVVKLVQDLTKGKGFDQLEDDQKIEMYSYLLDYYQKQTNLKKIQLYCEKILQVNRSLPVLMKLMKAFRAQHQQIPIYLQQSNFQSQDQNITILFTILKEKYDIHKQRQQVTTQTNQIDQLPPLQSSENHHERLNEFENQYNSNLQKQQKEKQLEINYAVNRNMCPRMINCWDKINEIMETVGLMTFYWYDKKQNTSKTIQGTGFLIASNAVVTAKHNFYQKDKIGVRCINCRIQFKNHKGQIVQYRSKPSSEWFQSQDIDYGLVILQKEVIHFKNNVKFLDRDDTVQMQKGQQLMLAGYSYDYRKQTIIDQLKILMPKYIENRRGCCEYQAQTVSGLSGSPVFYKYHQNAVYVVAMHISRRMATLECRGVLFSDKISNQIYHWIQLTKLKQYCLINCFNRFKDSIVSSSQLHLMTQLHQFQQNLKIINKQTSLQFFNHKFKQLIIDDKLKANREEKSEDVLVLTTSRLLNIYDRQKVKSFYEQLIQQIHRQLARLNMKLTPYQPVNLSIEPEQSSVLYDQKIQNSSLISALQQKSTSPSEHHPEDSQDEFQQFLSFFSSEKYIESKTLSILKGGNFIKIFYEIEQSNILFSRFIELRSKIYLNIINMVQAHHNLMPNFAIHHIVTKKQQQQQNPTEKSADQQPSSQFSQSKQILRVSVKNGYASSQWYKKFHFQIFIVFLRDLCKIIMDLQKHKIIFPDLRLDNILLEVQKEGFKHNSFDRDFVASNLRKIKFKLFNFDFSLSLQNQQVKENSRKLLKLGRKLLKEQTFNREPLYQFIQKYNQQEDLLQVYSLAIQSYNQYLLRHINHAQDMAKTNQMKSRLERILDLAERRNYETVVSELQTLIIQFDT